MTEHDDEASPSQATAAYWRHRRRTSWALAGFAVALVVRLALHNPRAWGDGRAAAMLFDVMGFGLWVAGLVAYISNARMAEQRGFIRGRFRRSPTDPAPDKA